MSQKYVEIWEASKSSRNVLNLGIYCQLKVYDWIFLVGFGCWGVLNTYRDLVNNPKAEYAKLESINSSDISANIAPGQAFFVELLTPAEEVAIRFTSDMMVHGDYVTAKQPVPQTQSKASGRTGISLSNIKAYTKDGEAVISASETIRSVQIVTAAGQVLASKQANSTEVRIPLGHGINIVKVQTENDVQTFKLMNN